MTTYYLGRAKDGRIVSRKSTNPDFTHAAIIVGGSHGFLPNFSTSAQGAARNFESNYRHSKRVPDFEVVAVKKVSAAEFRAAVTTPRATAQAARPAEYEVIDEMNAGAVVSQHPTYRTAFNAARRIEGPKPQGAVREFSGGRLQDWRYLVRRIQRT